MSVELATARTALYLGLLVRQWFKTNESLDNETAKDFELIAEKVTKYNVDILEPLVKSDLEVIRDGLKQKV